MVVVVVVKVVVVVAVAAARHLQPAQPLAAALRLPVRRVVRRRQTIADERLAHFIGPHLLGRQRVAEAAAGLRVRRLARVDRRRRLVVVAVALPAAGGSGGGGGGGGGLLASGGRGAAARVAGAVLRLRLDRERERAGDVRLGDVEKLRERRGVPAEARRSGVSSCGAAPC